MMHVCIKQDECIAYPDRCQGCEYEPSTETKITPHENGKLISFNDFLKSSGVPYREIPVGFSTLYRSYTVTFDEWFDLVLGFKKIDAEERSELAWNKCFGK